MPHYKGGSGDGSVNRKVSMSDCSIAGREVRVV